jgi:hypothetical protein
MTEDIEIQMRRALRPVDAPERFAERLMQRLPAREKPVVVALPVKVPRPARTFGLPVAFAASLLAAVLLGQQLAGYRAQRAEERELAAGLAAKQKLLQALRVTSKKLDMAYQAVNSPSAPAPSDSGVDDEENRS